MLSSEFSPFFVSDRNWLLNYISENPHCLKVKKTSTSARRASAPIRTSNFLNDASQMERDIFNRSFKFLGGAQNYLFLVYFMYRHIKKHKLYEGSLIQKLIDFRFKAQEELKIFNRMNSILCNKTQLPVAEKDDVNVPVNEQVSRDWERNIVKINGVFAPRDALKAIINGDQNLENSRKFDRAGNIVENFLRTLNLPEYPMRYAKHYMHQGNFGPVLAEIMKNCPPMSEASTLLGFNDIKESYSKEYTMTVVNPHTIYVNRTCYCPYAMLDKDELAMPLKYSFGGQVVLDFVTQINLDRDINSNTMKINIVQAACMVAIIKNKNFESSHFPQIKLDAEHTQKFFSDWFPVAENQEPSTLNQKRQDWLNDLETLVFFLGYLNWSNL